MLEASAHKLGGNIAPIEIIISMIKAYYTNPIRVDL
jgi:hypothetical protein